MGSSISAQAVVKENHENEDGEVEEEEDSDHGEESRADDAHLAKKILEQEPEMLACYASASPLSPQLSTLGTPRLGPSIKVWDPYNVLAPPPRFSRSFSSSSDVLHDDRTVTEVFLINHGECEISLKPEFVAGRYPEAALTPNGKRQSRALAVFLNSQGVRFAAVYSSPLERAKNTALSVSQDMNFSAEQIQYSDLLVEMSAGGWEGCLRSEIYTLEISNLIGRWQPDFSAPSGESLREVEFRMVRFLNLTLLGLPDKFGSIFSSRHQNDTYGGVVSKRKFGKSRLQIVTSSTAGNNEEDPGEDENSFPSYSQVSSFGVFTHSMPIKCLITGLLGCSSVMSSKICIDDSSVTVLRHTWKTGWQLQRLNDTSHLRLL